MAQNLVRFDWAMKKLLRSKTNFGILEGFLSELLNLDLKILKLLDSESNQNDKDDKQNRVDVAAQTSSGEIVLIEVQVGTELDYFQRMLYGSAKAIIEYIEKGQDYSNIKKVYSVNILYFDLGQGEDYIYHGKNIFRGIHYDDILQLGEKQKKLYKLEHVHQIYPEYYVLKVNQFNDIAKTPLDQWVYFLKKGEIQANFNAKGLPEAKKELDIMKLSPAEKASYEKYCENLRYNLSMIVSNYESGKIDGIEEGEKIGIEKGEKIALEKTAKKMKAAGISNKVIHEMTGLAIHEIELL